MTTGPKRIPYGKRKDICPNPMGQALFRLMEEKQTNLSVAIDVTSSKDLLSFADTVGPEICILKTHIDILEDFSLEVPLRLREIARQHQFLLFEDRKFADIGNTVAQQYGGGIYRIADWADIVNAHIVPGPGIIEGLKKVGLPKGQGLLLLAEMSSSGTLAKGSYTEAAVEMAKAHKDFVIGFISLRRLVDDPSFVHMTPGVQLKPGKDGMGQQYRSPQSVIAQGTDVIIVGRGIYEDREPLLAAKKYRQEGWDAYVKSLQN